MEKTSRDKKVTIQAAANALGVSKGTVIHYLNDGRLTRIREGSQVYILMDEIRALRGPDKRSGEIRALHEDYEDSDVTTPIPSSGDGDGANVTLDREHYEELLTRLGQVELENQNLLKYRDSIVDIKATLSQKETDLQQVEAKLHMMEEELRRLKNMTWWKRVFGREWKMTGG